MMAKNMTRRVGAWKHGQLRSPGPGLVASYDLLGAIIEIITTRDSLRIQKPATQIPHQSQHRDLDHKNGKKDRCLKMEGVEGDHMKIQWNKLSLPGQQQLAQISGIVPAKRYIYIYMCVLN